MANGAESKTPFPVRDFLVISSGLLTDGLVGSSLFPFVPHLVADCGIPEPEVGYYVRCSCVAPSRISVPSLRPEPCLSHRPVF